MHSSTSRRLGSLVSFDKTEDGLTGRSSEFNFRLRAFSTQVFQISISPLAHFEDFSYAVEAQPVPVDVAFEESPTHLTLSTGDVVVRIERKALRFSFSNNAGQILNEDEPGLGTSWIGEQVTTYKKLQDGERFIGLGEKTGPLDRKGSGYQNWNSDAYAYHGGSDPLYCSMPFYIGLHHGVQYGIYLDNSHKSFFNFGASNNRFSSFSADAGEMTYYFIYGNSIAEIIKNYTWLTGRIQMPPKWSIGYQQCRYSYYPDKEVLTTAQTFRDKDIPVDAVVLDIHYMDKYKIFTWDKKNFSNPSALINSLKAKGLEVVLMCDPGIKIEQGYEPYDDGLKNDVFIKYPDGENYSGQVWPGWCHFPDFTNPKTRQWWAGKLASYSSLGVEGFWNDMNEIATWGHMLPENIEFDLDGRKGTTRKARNLYGFQMARATFEAVKELLKGKRPFNLTRSGFSGVQRYSAVWTGDNVSYDEHMMLGVRLVNSLGLTGVAFCGYDVGGFVGEASTKLFARWISIGALSPFFRGHTMINTKDSEPWSFGEEVEQISRNYIKLRYQLLPYLYSLFYEASQSGMPVQRSLAIEYPHDSRVYNGQYHHQYFFGPSILVAPVESNKDFAKVFFPAGKWYSIFDGSVINGDQELIIETPIHRLPVYVKGGAVIPMQRAVNNTKETVNELILHVYHGEQTTSFEFYEDDGATYQFETGVYAKRSLEFIPANRMIKISAQSGEYKTDLQHVKLVLHGFSDVGSIRVNGQTKGCEPATHSFFTPLEKYDPINDPDSMGEEQVLICHFDYSNSSIDISW